MKENEWIDRLRQSAQDFQEPAPEGLWDDIDKEITPMLSRKKPKIMPVWVRLGGVAAAVALLFGIGNFFLFRDEPQSVILSKALPTQNPVGNGNNTRSPISSNPTISVGNVLAQNKIYPDKPHSNNDVKESEETVSEIVRDIIENTPTENIDTIPSANEKNDIHVADNSLKEINQNQYMAHSDIDIVLPKKHNPITLTAYADNMMMNHNSTQAGYGPVADSFIPNDGDMSDIPVGDSAATDILLSNQGEDVETTTTHRLPIRFGINVSFPIYERLNIETGLTYSILSSTTKSGTASNRFDTEQTLHYIGVPVRATYDVWNISNFGVYVTGGGMVEKCVYGRSVTDFVIGNESASSETEKIHERQFQFSVMAGIGVKWDITNYVNLFVEPGVSYYINNHSDVINSYKDKPFNFDFKIGLRFNINH